jgi:GMP synthase PP-ATPase subunit
LIRERPPPSFPQRLRRAKEEKQFDKFIEIMRQLHINIPLIEAIQQMSNYFKFMKDVLTKRRRIGEFETVALTQECSQMVQGKIPPKIKDPRTFTIPCTIRNVYVRKALCDLGASINLMPLYILK